MMPRCCPGLPAPFEARLRSRRSAPGLISPTKGECDLRLVIPLNLGNKSARIGDAGCCIRRITHHSHEDHHQGPSLAPLTPPSPHKGTPMATVDIWIQLENHARTYVHHYRWTG